MVEEADESGTKKLYQLEPNPVTYIVPIISILGRLVLIPVGDHDTIPAAMSNRKRAPFMLGKCGAQALAASCTASTRGSCAGPQTIPRNL